MTLKEKIAVMQAALDAKPIEAKRCGDEGRHPWIDCHAAEQLSWNWRDFNYRVKEEPRVLYIPEFGDPVVRLSHFCYGNHEEAARGSGYQTKRIIKFVEVLDAN